MQNCGVSLVKTFNKWRGTGVGVLATCLATWYVTHVAVLALTLLATTPPYLFVNVVDYFVPRLKLYMFS